MAHKPAPATRAAAVSEAEATVTIPLSMLTDNRSPRIIQIGDGQLLLLSAQPVSLGSNGLEPADDDDADDDFGASNGDDVDTDASQFIASLSSSLHKDSDTLLGAVNSSADYADIPELGSGRSRTRKPKQTKNRSADAALPEDAELEEEPLYVNAKQFERILARRRARARLEARGIYVKERPKYLHESRHRHAANRKRGPGGQFDNPRKPDAGKTDAR